MTDSKVKCNMKKLVFMLTAVCVALFTFTACANDNYEKLNDMLELDYSKIVITVKDTFFEDLPLSDFNEEISLTSKYEITYSNGDTANVHYTVEQFAQIDGMVVDENLATPKKLEGDAVIKNGELVSKTDDGVWLPTQILDDGLDFEKEYFKNADFGDGHFVADVINPSAFMGTSIVCTEMRAGAGFSGSFDNIVITYKSDGGNKVKIIYDFYL